jgi:zinc/manganese transport system substrate-binding protein
MLIPRRLSILAALLPVLLGALHFAACSEAGEGADSEVVATTVQVGALAHEVAGDVVTVHVLVGPGVDPHDYEATADDIRRVGEAEVVLRNGIGLDAFLDSAIESSGASNVVTVTEGIEVRHASEDAPHEEEGTHEEGEAGHEHGDEDPHVWHDPLNDKIMVDNIVAALSAAFPDDASAFRTNGDAYKAKLDAADAEIRALIEAIPDANRKVVTNHDAFGYFFDRYGLEFVGAVIPGVDTTSGEASAQQIAALQDTIEREGVRAIFSEDTVDPKVARELANDTGVTIVDDLYGDSLGEPGSGAETIDGMLLANATKIADALK